jgi:gamma-glutamylcyclotransferase (GGCT)/AIG2-like uncharacterized protein YtfP
LLRFPVAGPSASSRAGTLWGPRFPAEGRRGADGLGCGLASGQGVSIDSCLAMPLPIFVYGTTLLEHTQRVITGRTFPMRPAMLRGFRRGLVDGKLFPSLKPDHKGEVAGAVLEQVDYAHLDLLDRYEGECWERIRVEVELSPGAPTSAWAWLLKAPFDQRVTDKPFDLERYLSYDLEVFLDQLGLPR